MGAVHHRDARRRAGDHHAAAGAVSEHRAAAHLGQHHLSRRLGQDAGGFGHPGHRAAHEGPRRPAGDVLDQRLVRPGQRLADLQCRHQCRCRADAGAEQGAAGAVAAAPGGAEPGRHRHQDRHRLPDDRRAVLGRRQRHQHPDRRLHHLQPGRCHQPHRRRGRCADPGHRPCDATVARPGEAGRLRADALGHRQRGQRAERADLRRPGRRPAGAAGPAAQRDHHRAQQAAVGARVPRDRAEDRQRRQRGAPGRCRAGRAGRRELQRRDPLQGPALSGDGRAPGRGSQRDRGGRCGQGPARRTAAGLPPSAADRADLRHQPLREGVDRGRGPHPARGGGAGGADHVSVHAELARHPDPGDHRARGAAGHLRGAGGLRLLDQQPDDVRPGAGHRPAGGRRDRGGRERRARDGRGRPVAARGHPTLDAGDHRRAGGHRAGAVGGVRADGLLRRLDRGDLPPVLDHRGLGDAAVGRGGDEPDAGAVRHAAQAAAAGRASCAAPRSARALLRRLQPGLRPRHPRPDRADRHAGAPGRTHDAAVRADRRGDGLHVPPAADLLPAGGGPGRADGGGAPALGRHQRAADEVDERARELAGPPGRHRGLHHHPGLLRRPGHRPRLRPAEGLERAHRREPERRGDRAARQPRALQPARCAGDRDAAADGARPGLERRLHAAAAGPCRPGPRRAGARPRPAAAGRAPAPGAGPGALQRPGRRRTARHPHR